MDNSMAGAALVVKGTFLQFQFSAASPQRRARSEPRSTVPLSSQEGDLFQIPCAKERWSDSIDADQASTVATCPGSPCSSAVSDSDVISVSCASESLELQVIQLDAPACFLPLGFVPVPILDRSQQSSLMQSMCCAEARSEFAEAKPIEAFSFDWIEDGKRLRSSRTRITRSRALPGGDFVFTVFPQRQSQKRGGASFQASGGRGNIEVKCSTSAAPCRLVAVAMGPKTQKVSLDFCEDGVVHRVPQTWNFESGVDARTDQFKISFSFEPLSRC